MARQVLNVNSPTVYNPTDPRRTAYTKINANFAELYARSELYTLVLGADVTNAEAVANTLVAVTNLGIALEANALYDFEYHLVYTAAATTTGSRFTLNGPAATYLNYSSEYSLTTTTTTRNALLQAYNVPAACNATSAATGNNWALIKGVIQPSAAGNLVPWFASEVSASAIVVKAGSFVRYQKIR